jgi:NAD(P)-dependent dehydrogenase (short-subunit alcohol dehydrogenase family)
LKLSEEAIEKEVPSANIRRLIFDLSSLAAVRKAAAEVNAYAEPLHVGLGLSAGYPVAQVFPQVLINNAAAAYGPFKLTVDNLEAQMATGHVGPFLFTKLLAPKLLASATASYTPRVVFVSGMSHAMGTGVNFSTIKNPDPETYQIMEVYGQTKSANILTAIELSKRSKGKINAYSLHPGGASSILAAKNRWTDRL